MVSRPGGDRNFHFGLEIQTSWKLQIDRKCEIDKNRRGSPSGWFVNDTTRPRKVSWVLQVHQLLMTFSGHIIDPFAVARPHRPVLTVAEPNTIGSACLAWLKSQQSFTIAGKKGSLAFLMSMTSVYTVQRCTYPIRSEWLR